MRCSWSGGCKDEMLLVRGIALLLSCKDETLLAKMRRCWSGGSPCKDEMQLVRGIAL